MRGANLRGHLFCIEKPMVEGVILERLQPGTKSLGRDFETLIRFIE